MKIFSLIVLFLLIASLPVAAQQQQGQNQNQSNVIDLTQLGKTYTISARMELPQVKIFDQRIVPDFKAVTAEKSFESELKSEAEVINYEPITSGKVEQIKNINELINKKRF